MSLAAAIAALFLAGSCLVHAGSMFLVAIWRARARPVGVAAHEPVSLVRTVCGLDGSIERSLRDGFALGYPSFELIFCAHAEADAAVPFVRSLIEANPAIRARLLIGDNPISRNPKLNNMVKSWDEAEHDCLVFCDDNVRLPRDYLERLLAARTRESGAVSTIYIGAEPGNPWAHLECAFLNGFEARWYMAVAATGNGFVNGKTMLVSRREIDAAGGIEALAAELAEDAALTKIVRRAGREIVILAMPLVQPLGVRTADDVLGRQVRWARLRRLSYLPTFVAEFLAGNVFPAIATILLAHDLGMSIAGALGAEMAFWYGTELLFLAWSRWPVSVFTLPASIVRDICLPVIWLLAWRRGGSYAWRGKRVYGS